MVGVAWAIDLFLPVWYFIIKGKPFTATVDLQLQIYWSQAVFIYSFLVHIAWSKTLPFYAQFSYKVQINPFRFRECKNFTYCSIFLKRHYIKEEIIWTAMLLCCGLLAISNVGAKSKFVKVFTKAKIKRYKDTQSLMIYYSEETNTLTKFAGLSHGCLLSLPLMVILMLIAEWQKKSKIISNSYCFATSVFQQIHLKWYFIRNYLWLTCTFGYTPISRVNLHWKMQL